MMPPIDPRTIPAFDRRRFLQTLSAAAGAACAGIAPPAVRAADENPELSAEAMMTTEAQRAIDAGLAFLASRQQTDGAFGAGGYSRDVAVSALAGMAFMAAGSTPSRGPYGECVERSIRYLIENTQDSGYINVPGSGSHGPMYGHGFATLFLAETYGMTRNSEIRDKLSRAVNLICNTQNTDGGWRYQPIRKEADISVTICQIMALRAAKNAGMYVPADVIDKCIDYVKKSQNADGGFMYMISGGQSAFPRSAAGVVALYSAGIYEGPEVERGLSYIMDYMPHGAGFNRESHYFYGHYYAVQAMWIKGGDHWKRWFPAVRDELIQRQRKDGSWMDSICQEYGTAMACIIMQIPNNYLPIFQR
ncbi:MAG: terpene cyclase/mutase family protein [Planctomycetia bacterium]|nr:terpene cyclase/mutase family protein [Planctomycetia bacterium]